MGLRRDYTTARISPESGGMGTECTTHQPFDRRRRCSCVDKGVSWGREGGMPVPKAARCMCLGTPVARLGLKQPTVPSCNANLKYATEGKKGCGP